MQHAISNRTSKHNALQSITGVEKTEINNNGIMMPGQNTRGNIGKNSNVPLSNRLDPLEDVLGTFPVVRVRGMPFEASVEDILNFFHGALILDVVMITRCDGRTTGEALVLFTNPMDLNLAISRDKQHMGHRYIEVFQAKRMDYYIAVTSQMSQHSDHRLNVPNVSGYRNGFSQVNMGSAIHYHNNNGSSTMNSLPQSLMPMHMAHQSGSPGNHKIEQHCSSHSSVIRLRGLPFTATKTDILNFFQGLDVLEESVKFVMRPDGRVSGEAFVTLSTPSEAEAAMLRHRNLIGNRYIELFPSGIEEAARQISRHQR
mmetsp:Transcript_2523/g.3714  ORF Transcript_2523/g.3714 Transcript_2523/m.3714 type:complete len:314 (-) Transcript_2523:282-1223(-)